jgi:hypothetical protein
MEHLSWQVLQLSSGISIFIKVQISEITVALTSLAPEHECAQMIPKTCGTGLVRVAGVVASAGSVLMTVQWTPYRVHKSLVKSIWSLCGIIVDWEIQHQSAIWTWFYCIQYVSLPQTSPSLTMHSTGQRLVYIGSPSLTNSVLCHYEVLTFLVLLPATSTQVLLTLQLEWTRLDQTLLSWGLLFWGLSSANIKSDTYISHKDLSSGFWTGRTVVGCPTLEWGFHWDVQVHKTQKTAPPFIHCVCYMYTIHLHHTWIPKISWFHILLNMRQQVPSLCKCEVQQTPEVFFTMLDLWHLQKKQTVQL